jgi:hypothetical protein
MIFEPGRCHRAPSSEINLGAVVPGTLSPAISVELAMEVENRGWVGIHVTPMVDRQTSCARSNENVANEVTPCSGSCGTEASPQMCHARRRPYVHSRSF